MKTVVGLVLMSLGVSLFLLSFLSAAKTDTVIDVSFVLAPNETYGPYQNGAYHAPYQNGTYHHTRVISKSALMGEVLVEGGGINFTAYGYNTQHLENILINQNYSFVIDPADDLYTFTFENTGSIQSSITFTLKERWIYLLLLIPGLIGILILTPAGIFLFIMRLRKKPTQAHRSNEKCVLSKLILLNFE